MALTLTKPDDTALDDISLTAERGVPSAHVSIKITNAGDDAVEGAYLVLYGETAPGSGVYSSTGQPVVDERQGRFQITDQDTSVTPGQEIVLGQVQVLGHLKVALLPTILSGDSVTGEFWIEQAGASAGGGAIGIKLEVANETTAYPLPQGVSSVGTGIESGRAQSESFLISGRTTLATGTPDDAVHVGAGRWLILGEEQDDDGSTWNFTLDQNDGASAALTTGESYIAVLTQNSTSLGPNATKGLKGTTPDRPTPPSGELILAWVSVVYQAGASVIGQSDITSDLTYGRFFVDAPATGLSVIVHAGRSIIDGFYQVRPTKGAVALVAGSTNRIWLEWTGAITVTQSDPPPSAGAVLLGVAVTDGTDITSYTDRRTFIVTGSPAGEALTLADSVDNNNVSYRSSGPVAVMLLGGITGTTAVGGFNLPEFAQILVLVLATGSIQVDLKNLYGGSVAQNQMNLLGSDISLTADGQAVTIVADPVSKVWRLVAKNF